MSDRELLGGRVIAYEDLDLRIQADGREFSVVARRGDQVVQEPFHPVRCRSWDLEDLEKRGPEVIKRRGAALFNSLIRGRVRDLYQQGRGGAGSDGGKGVRIRIRIDSRDMRLRRFMHVPWEILYDASADASHLIALDPRRVIVRMIDSSEPRIDPPKGKLERVLLVLANPGDTDRLKIDTESKRAEEALSRSGIHPDVLRHARRMKLHDRIRETEPQVVHFMGHGELDSREGEGVLLLEGSLRRSDPLHASALATFFSGDAMPRLVILNACVSAAAGRSRTFKAFSSVAAALIAKGLPAVVAMQSTIRDVNAVRFTERLYGALIRGKPIEAAISDARTGLSSRDRYMLDWAAPVLYVREHRAEVMETEPPSQATQVPEPPQNLPAIIPITGAGSVIFGNVHQIKNVHK